MLCCIINASRTQEPRLRRHQVGSFTPPPSPVHDRLTDRPPIQGPPSDGQKRIRPRLEPTVNTLSLMDRKKILLVPRDRSGFSVELKEKRAPPTCLNETRAFFGVTAFRLGQPAGADCENDGPKTSLKSGRLRPWMYARVLLSAHLYIRAFSTIFRQRPLSLSLSLLSFASSFRSITPPPPSFSFSFR